MSGSQGDRDWHAFAAPHRRDVDAGGYSMHCVDRGRGEAVLLVHGFGDSTYCWHQNLEALSDAGFRAVAVDQPGLGRSGTPPQGHRFRLEDQSEGVAALADALGLERYSVVGHSMGGAIALHLALRAPERIRRLALVAPACYRPAHLLALRLPGLEFATRFLPREWVVRSGLLGVHFDLRKVTAALVHEYANARPGDDYLDAVFRLADGFFSDEFDAMTARYGEIRAPVLCLMGRQDLQIPLSFADRLLREVPGSRLTVFRDSGHMPHQEQAGEFNRALVDFLKEPEGSVSRRASDSSGGSRPK